MLPAAALVLGVAGGCATSSQDAAPPDRTDRPPAVAAVEVVAVDGTACDRAVAGSGWLAAPGVVVTAAHVVAGVRSPAVTGAGGGALAATVVAVDPVRDLAVLAVAGAGVDVEPVLLREPTVGEAATVVVRPDDPDGPRPVRVTSVIRARGPDIRGEGDHLRDVAVLEGDVRPGDSGAPVVADGGDVLGVVVAVSTDVPGRAYAVRPAEIDAVLDAVLDAVPAPDGVDTGPCLA